MLVSRKLPIFLSPIGLVAPLVTGCSVPPPPLPPSYFYGGQYYGYSSQQRPIQPLQRYDVLPAPIPELATPTPVSPTPAPMTAVPDVVPLNPAPSPTPPQKTADGPSSPDPSQQLLDTQAPGNRCGWWRLCNLWE